MQFLFNESNSQVSIFFNDRSVNLGPYQSMTLSNDQKTVAEAKAWALRFPVLKIVDKSYIDKINAAGNSPQVMVGNPSQAQTQVSVSSQVIAPQVQTLSNENAETVNVYKVPVYNSILEIVEFLSIMHNEDLNTVTISTTANSNLSLKLIDKTVKKAKQEIVNPVLDDEVAELTVNNEAVKPQVKQAEDKKVAVKATK